MHKNLNTAAIILAILALSMTATTAWAAPQESVTYTSVSADGLLGATVNANTSATFSGGYTAYRIRISAQITEVNTGDFASEGRIYVTPPVGQGFVIQPFTTTSYVGTFVTTANGAGVVAGTPVECVMNLPAGGIPAVGTWNFRFYESADDTGIDKTWDTVTITLDDDAPNIVSLSGPAFTESEVNDLNTAGPATVLQPNPNYNLVSPMLASDTLNGLTTGTSTNGLATSIDYFRVEPATASLAIYEYSLAITTAGTAGHTGSIRGHGQLSPVVTPQPSGFIDARNDIAFQGTSASASGTTTARTNKWYGFGKAGEAILYSISGTTATTANYVVTLSRTTITPIPIVGTVVPGPITIARAGHTNTVDMWLYNSNYDPIAGAGSDGNTTLTRTLAPGVYYLAVSNVNLANELPSPPDSSSRTNNVLNHINTLANSSTATVTNLNMSVTSSAGTISSTGAAKTGGFDVVWMTFTVSAVDCNSNGTNDSNEPGFADCNSNGTMDSCEITAGATDCNSNNSLDICEGGCNTNGTPDSCEIAANPSLDCNTDNSLDLCQGGCNTNGTPDACEIAANPSLDCNTDNTLDLCQGGCNTNGIPDICDINANPSLDCNTDNTIDACQLAGNDCNTNGSLDSCELFDGAPDCNTNNVIDACDLVSMLLVNSVDIPKTIPDNNTNGVNSLILSPSSSVVTDVDVGILIRHTWQGDIKLVVTRLNDNMAVTIVDRPGVPQNTTGFNSDNFGNPTTLAQMIFDDASTNTTYDQPAVASPGLLSPVGSWKPENALSAFNGFSAAGTWQLSITDNAGGDTGTVLAWSLKFSFQAADCNTNGTPDNCEIAEDPCDDCNANGTLDVCETQPVVCPGDLDHDGDIDGDDFALFLNTYGLSTGDGGFNSEADLDSSGQVNLVDYQLWLQRYHCFSGSPRPPAPTNVGDMNIDNKVDGNDVNLYMNRLIVPASMTFRDYFVMDCNHDGLVNTADVQTFVQLLLSH